MTSEKIENATVLVIDDNPSNLTVLCSHLEKSGFKTLVAEDGEDGISNAVLAKPDIILLDIMMPGIDGFEACRLLKENDATRDIPVIFISALSETFDKVEAFKLGAADYITKPFQQEEVLARITRELTIQRQKKELLELNATKDKFFSIIAHDMKNTFSGIIGFSKLLSESFTYFERDDLEALAKDMHDNAQITLKLLENLLNWARVQTGGMVFEPTAIDLCEIAHTNIEVLRETARQKGIYLSHSVREGTFVYTDPDMADAIFRNLISNAIKFTHFDGRIDISAEPSGEFVEISVVDTGVGISENDRNKLFEIANKCKAKGTAGEQGTGLGLILCKEFVEKNNGKIWIESEVGKGTTFKFTLPIG